MLVFRVKLDVLIKENMFAAQFQNTVWVSLVHLCNCFLVNYTRTGNIKMAVVIQHAHKRLHDILLLFTCLSYSAGQSSVSHIKCCFLLF